MLIHQPQFLQQDAGPIRPEAAAVKPDVEQPVVFVVGFFGGGVEQKLAVRFLALQADFDLKRPDLIEPQGGHVTERDGGQSFQKLSIRVVPEYDPLPFFVEQAIERCVDLLEIAHSSSFPPVIALASASRSPNLP